MQGYADRFQAGQVLAESLSSLRAQSVLVLALPRGGVPVGYAIATELEASLDVIVVRKLGVPMQPELAMGAIALGGVRILNAHVLSAAHVAEEEIDRVAHEELKELHRREAAYRGNRPLPSVTGRIVILVDDGIATGATMRAAIAATRKLQPARLVVAVPVGPSETIVRLEQEADWVVCPLKPSHFFGISQFYDDFSQMTDEEVRELLRRAWTEEGQRSRVQSGRAEEALGARG